MVTFGLEKKIMPFSDSRVPDGTFKLTRGNKCNAKNCDFYVAFK